MDLCNRVDPHKLGYIPYGAGAFVCATTSHRSGSSAFGETINRSVPAI